MNAVLDELGVDVRRAILLEIARLEETCRDSGTNGSVSAGLLLMGRNLPLVEKSVMEQAEVLQAIPLSARLSVLP